ncbi:ADP-ribosyl-[dinitrogen reductase] hydrolase [Insolitispirillum peregrinum]|uniref:ADP-ribosyl-[dinitrogen reductase] hydrolase n=1 Tax=Insolitispirillum peregrinum TaxID=80876 RepID=A0A1N7ILE5_9PROT|nr:ADP-ribosyl-[dinitrogen reductase] hydrolase [Insolitispirillum peregrinum]SIS37811.1 ADP-ribosyl-[dinitrogen reductase] hydrolase [Insolitispirillum peregrinum]
MSDTSISLYQRAVGAYMGLAVGDALGATVEFMTRGEIQQHYGVHQKIIGGGWLRLKPGQVTDDTQMSLSLGRALISRQGMDTAVVCEHFADWLRSKPVDVGNTVRRGIQRYILHGTTRTEYHEGDAGNGAAMRTLPVALATVNNPQALEEWTLAQAHTTHNHPLSDSATLTLGRMIHRLLAGGGVKAVREESNALLARHKSFRFEPYRGQASAYIIDTMQTVQHCYFMTDSFKSCLVETVNQGGDADTTGAIAGMLAGATYGVDAIPRSWLSKLDPAVASEIHQQTTALLKLAGVSL